MKNELRGFNIDELHASKKRRATTNIKVIAIPATVKNKKIDKSSLIVNLILIITFFIAFSIAAQFAPTFANFTFNPI